MQFGIKSLLGGMVLLAAFVMGVFQFSAVVCVWTLLLAHAFSPALWIAGWYSNQSRGLKTFFLSGFVSGITPWIGTLYWCIMIGIENGLNASIPDELEKRLLLLAVWVQACCQPPVAIAPSLVPPPPIVVDPLAAEAKLEP